MSLEGSKVFLCFLSSSCRATENRPCFLSGGRGLPGLSWDPGWVSASELSLTHFHPAAQSLVWVFQENLPFFPSTVTPWDRSQSFRSSVASFQCRDAQKPAAPEPHQPFQPVSHREAPLLSPASPSWLPWEVYPTGKKFPLSQMIFWVDPGLSQLPRAAWQEGQGPPSRVGGRPGPPLGLGAGGAGCETEP